ncbi:MAG: hypothetical protein U0X91_20785 [Spirosomataceae bacterium]
MSFLWKIEPFDIPSTDRTQPPKQIVGLEIMYLGGKVTVLEDAVPPLTLVIDYYDNEGRKREYLQDRIEVETIRNKGLEAGFTGESLDVFVGASMNTIVKHLIGGNTLQERRDALATLAQLFGQVVLPANQQTGTI